ncbi:MAG TPA: hypothetical protein VEJ63_07445 [Planctomycetota bacterium]|nr:hypothetical protein [Planctomycetota bacterium]
MTPIDEAELSGYLDGELSPENAEKVREAMERNPALKAEYERLAALDAACHRAAGTSPFKPAISLPSIKHPPIRWVAVIAAITALTVSYLAPKSFALLMITAVTLHTAILGVVLWLTARAIRASTVPSH